MFDSARVQFWMFIDGLQAYNGAVTAAATAFIGIFTLVLAFVTNRQAKLTKASVKIAERALIDAERPYIFIFGIHGFYEVLDVEDSAHWVDYSIVNHGRTPAIVTSYNTEFFINTPSKLITNKPNSWTPFIFNPIMIVGEKREAKAYLAFKDPKMPIPYTYENEPDRLDVIVPTLADTENLYVRVFILYDGPFTKGHETSACWRWDKKEWRFVVEGKYSQRK